MTRRCLLTLIVALALTSAPAARAQQDTPFGPVPTPAPTVEPAPGEDQIGRGTLYLIGIAVLVGVVAIGYAISRDARKSLTPEDRSALSTEERTAKPEAAREASARARKQRSKAKAARAQRKRNRKSR